MPTLTKRVYNFSAGPAALPLEVLEQIKADLPDYQGSGMSVMEMSHRGKTYEAIHAEAQANLRKLLNVPDDYAVLFLQGGATTQFSLVPMNLAGAGQTADYVHTGSWAKAAMEEAKFVTKVNIAADSSKASPARMPSPSEIKATPGAAYLHVTSNETIGGTQWKSFPKSEAPLVCDMSSDILSRPVNVKDFGLIYAGAQKNMGPSGVTVVILKKDLAQRAPATLPKMFRYATHIENDSMLNTPPCFSIYVLMLVTRWALKLGGVAAMEKASRERAAKIYALLDGGYYRGTADKAHRSDMNVTFRLPSEALEEKFLKESQSQGMSGLKGHRSVGGVRASIYNAFPAEGIDALVAFMKDFQAKNG